MKKVMILLCICFIFTLCSCNNIPTDEPHSPSSSEYQTEAEVLSESGNHIIETEKLFDDIKITFSADRHFNFTVRAENIGENEYYIQMPSNIAVIEIINQDGEKVYAGGVNSISRYVNFSMSSPYTDSFELADAIDTKTVGKNYTAKAIVQFNLLTADSVDENLNYIGHQEDIREINCELELQFN